MPNLEMRFSIMPAKGEGQKTTTRSKSDSLEHLKGIFPRKRCDYDGTARKQP